MLKLIQSGRVIHRPCLLLLPSIMETCSNVLTFEFVGKILWCDHLNKRSLKVFFCMVPFLFFNILQIKCGILTSGTLRG